MSSKNYVSALTISLATVFLLLITGATYHIDILGKVAVFIEVLILCSIIIFFAIVGIRALNDEE